MGFLPVILMGDNSCNESESRSSHNSDQDLGDYSESDQSDGSTGSPQYMNPNQSVKTSPSDGRNGR
jgi:hypothetical protein